MIEYFTVYKNAQGNTGLYDSCLDEHFETKYQGVFKTVVREYVNKHKLDVISVCYENKSITVWFYPPETEYVNTSGGHRDDRFRQLPRV